MKVGTKEFYEMQIQFEKSVMHEDSEVYISDLSRVKNGEAPIGIFYNNGMTNKLFHAYMLGYQNGRLNYMPQ